MALAHLASSTTLGKTAVADLVTLFLEEDRRDPPPPIPPPRPPSLPPPNSPPLLAELDRAPERVGGPSVGGPRAEAAAGEAGQTGE